MRTAAAGLTVVTLMLCAACGKSFAQEEKNVTVTLFAAKSLHNVMEEIITEYHKTFPEVEVTANYDSSGTLEIQIEEGASCDVFFSAAQAQMDRLEQLSFVVDGTRQDIVGNQVCIVTYPDSGTAVRGLSDLHKASSIALAGASVPVGAYTRQAMLTAGLLETEKSAAEIETREISQALGGVEINECANVGAVTAAVAEGANEIGMVYDSDIYGMEEKLEILEKLPYELTGAVTYPVAQILNRESDEATREAARTFVLFLQSETAKTIFEKYGFDTEFDGMEKD